MPDLSPRSDAAPRSSILAGAFVLAAAAVSPPCVAITLGELVAESRIGEPFRGQVSVTASGADRLEASCFRLAPPPIEIEGPHRYLLSTRFALEGTGPEYRLRMDGGSKWKEPFLQLLLQADCGTAKASREYTVLIDPPGMASTISPAAMPPAAFLLPVSAPAGTAERALGSGTELEVREGDTVSAIARAIYPDSRAMRSRLAAEIVRQNPHAFREGNADRMLAGTVIVIPDLRRLAAGAPGAQAVDGPARREPVEKPGTAAKRKPAPAAAAAPAREDRAKLPAAGAVAKAESMPLPPTQAEPNARTRQADFRLRLSGTDLSVSLIGKLTEEQRKFLRERQFLLDADDQMASFLALRSRVSELEKQLESMRLKMSPAVAMAAPAQPAPAALPARPHPASVPAAAPLESDSWQVVKYGLTLYLLPFSQIVLAVLALFFALRYYNGIKEHLAARGLLRRAPKSKRRAVVVEPETGAPPLSEFDRKMVIAAAAAPAAPEPAIDSVDGILEEAQLYVIHGHPDQAIGLLEDQIRSNRGEVRIWMLLFVILRSQGMKVEFEKLAKRFHNAIRDEELWENIQTLGNELEPENELYMNDRIRAQRAMAASPGALDFTLDGVPAEGEPRAGGLDLDLGRGHGAAAPAPDIDFDAIGAPGRDAPQERR
ncbi:MAG: hypothetical protein HYU77_04320 [Betaproteobacteria bacterium]|nr:hypothetical protein [Betaproteobacteria bacterium]